MLVTCIAFSISKPFKKPMWTNPIFTVSLIFLWGYHTYLLFGGSEKEYELFTIVENFPMDFRVKLFFYCLGNAVALYLWEKIGVWYITLWRKRVSAAKKAALEEERLMALTEK